MLSLHSILGELVSILITFEMNLHEQKQGYKTKNIALLAGTSSKKLKATKVTLSSTEESDSHNDLFDEEASSIILFTKRLNTLLRLV